MSPRDAAGAPLFTPRLEHATRLAALWHRDQRRKGSDLPYVQHLAAVAAILDRLDFVEDVVIAGWLHDAVEDTGATLDEIEAALGAEVRRLVALLTERKRDESGRPRPWSERKAEHLEALAAAPPEARAVALADKLHNLVSIHHDLRAGIDVWARFNAGRAESLAHYRRSVERLAANAGDPRLDRLARACRAEIEAIERIGVADHGAPPP
jgi:(p)ppGpp synthase/HD superfamily hydrolase